jgi:hypothetical protein
MQPAAGSLLQSKQQSVSCDGATVKHEMPPPPHEHTTQRRQRPCSNTTKLPYQFHDPPKKWRSFPMYAGQHWPVRSLSCSLHRTQYMYRCTVQRSTLS